MDTRKSHKSAKITKNPCFTGIFCVIFKENNCRRDFNMSKKYLSLEEQEALKNNQYVKKVTEKSITYTEKFKEEFYEEYQGGKSANQVLREMGFDIDALGKERIRSIIRRTKEYAQRFEGFKDIRGSSYRPMPKDLPVEEQLERLKHRNALLEQENEFLKKVARLEKNSKRNMQHKLINSN